MFCVSVGELELLNIFFYTTLWFCTIPSVNLRLISSSSLLITSICSPWFLITTLSLSLASAISRYSLSTLCTSPFLMLSNSSNRVLSLNSSYILASVWLSSIRCLFSHSSNLCNSVSMWIFICCSTRMWVRHSASNFCMICSYSLCGNMILEVEPLWCERQGGIKHGESSKDCCS